MRDEPPATWTPTKTASPHEVVRFHCSCIDGLRSIGIAAPDTDRWPQKPSCQTLMGQPALLTACGWPINLTRAKL